MAEAGAGTYVYCLLSGVPSNAADGVPGGLPGLGPPRLLAAGDDLVLVVADAPLDLYGAHAIADRLGDLDWVSTRAVAHGQVIEHFVGDTTVLPMKLFTIFSSDERAIADVLERQAEIDEIVARVAGCVELGIRVHFDDEAARRAVRERAGSAEDGEVSGTDFLRRKKATRDVAAELVSRASSEAAEAFAELAAHAAESRRHAAPAAGRPSPLLLDVAFLVRAGQIDAFEAAVDRAADRLAPHHGNVVLSGPWPPYNFVDAGGDITDGDVQAAGGAGRAPAGDEAGGDE